jgi:hypothetical protein
LQPGDYLLPRLVELAHAVLEGNLAEDLRERRPLAEECSLIIQHLVEKAEKRPANHGRRDRSHRAADACLCLMLQDGAEQLDA